MKFRILLLLCFLVRMSFGQVVGDWPANPASFVYFGAPQLSQTAVGNYALLQDKGNGITFLNSPLDIRFRIGNGEQMILSNSGNFGFGTTSPAVWFGGGKVFEMSAVRPVLKLASTAPTGLSTIVFTNSSVNATTHAGEFHVNYQFNQTNNDKSTIIFGGYPTGNTLAIQADGNVGIGTPTPAIKLDIQGAGAANTDLRVNGRIQTGDGSNLGGIWVSTTASMFMGQVNTNSLGLYNGGWRLIADNNGNVGIGTTSPDAKLTVKGDIHTKEVRVDVTGPWLVPTTSSKKTTVFSHSLNSRSTSIGTNTYPRFPLPKRWRPMDLILRI